ncbi:MAG: exosortase system-associated protein, TIGR04073 family [Deltaproteobacteria bacterium]|nr:MAG: exosortase system-associated protein, TIGR04073 family [Deltaproteobacteria bacterium]
MARSLTLAALVLLLASPAGAQTATRKFGRGLAGMTTSVLEVPGNIVAESRARGYGEGIPLGFAKGLGMIIPRTLVGVWEFVSAPFPVPADYRPILNPEFPWGYFEGGRPETPAPTRKKPHR